MKRQLVVKLVGEAVQRGETRPRDGREVMVLVVQSNIVCQDIQRSVVRVCLWDRDLVRGVESGGLRLLEDVVFGDKVAGARVQAPRQERAQYHISHCLSTDEVGQGVVEGELDDDVEEVDFRERELVHEHGTEGVEEDLEGGEEGFAGDGIEEEGLESGREIGVQAIDTEGLVVGEVVGLRRKLASSFLNFNITRSLIRTLNDALYGIPIGRFANTAKTLFASGFLKARLCEISWMARNRFWFAVAPMTYAVRKKGHERKGVSRRRYAHSTWSATTPVTTYLVRGSGPQSLVTWRRRVSTRKLRGYDTGVPLGGP